MSNTYLMIRTKKASLAVVKATATLKCKKSKKKHSSILSFTDDGSII